MCTFQIAEGQLTVEQWAACSKTLTILIVLQTHSQKQHAMPLSVVSPRG